MRPPIFWHSPRNAAGLLPVLLTPLSWLWKASGQRRLAKGPRLKMPVPVVCVGNINIGGTGKTPTAIALQAALAETGTDAHIISRGYGGTETGPLRVNERQHSATDVGDEPLLMSAFGPVWVAKDRGAGAKAAVDAGAELILLDDGFQNAALHQDFSIVVVDAAIGFGNGRVIPAGPLRENLETGLARADLIVSIGEASAQAKLTADWPELSPKRRLCAKLSPLATGMDWQGVRVLAFAGIGRPEKFFRTLRAQGANIVISHEFDDHAAFSDAVLHRLKSEAQKNNCQLVTTEKDAMRLPLAFRPEVLSLPVRLEFENPGGLTEILAAITGR